MGWVEYCNSDNDSHFANMRRQNGREKPYGVRSSSSHPIQFVSHPFIGQILGSRQRVLGPLAN